jgi:predicted RNase H-like HicB family nuclease
MKNEYEHCSMVIQWSEPDKAYIVTVPELPGCKTHGDTYKEAVRHGQEAIETWIEGSKAFGLPISQHRFLLPDAI